MTGIFFLDFGPESRRVSLPADPFGELRWRDPVSEKKTGRNVRPEFESMRLCARVSGRSHPSSLHQPSFPPLP
jgi:hypothetical protein